MTRHFRIHGKCLNAGCGEGLYSAFLEAFEGISEIVHVDVNVPRQVLDSSADDRHRAAAASLTHLPFRAAIFDCCLCTEVIEHIEDENLAASELARVLKSGGVLLLSAPEVPSPFDPAHVRQGYTFSHLHALLSRHGFTVLERRDCLHMFTRIMMWLWRHPIVVFGRHRTPYMPNGLAVLFALADRHLRVGKPWDLIVLARRDTVQNLDHDRASDENSLANQFAEVRSA
jgi:SAM-dependent methyltransferase